MAAEPDAMMDPAVAAPADAAVLLHEVVGTGLVFLVDVPAILMAV